MAGFWVDRVVARNENLVYQLSVVSHRSPEALFQGTSWASSDPSVVHSLAMPSIKSLPGPHRFFFYSFDCNEPMHVHVQREKMVCKFWLEPVELARSAGFSRRELGQIMRADRGKPSQHQGSMG